MMTNCPNTAMQEVKYLNKKRFLLSLATVLIAIASMLLIANSLPLTTHCYIGTLSQYQNVINPSRILSAPDASYATFGGGSVGSQLTGKVSLSVPVPSGANGWVYAYSASASTVNIYSANSATGPWSYVGTTIVGTTPLEYTTSGGSFPGTHSYIGIYNSGSVCYIDAGGAVY